MNVLILTIVFPLIGFMLLAFSQGKWSENYSAIIGIGSVGLAALVTVYLDINFFNNKNQQMLFNIPLWSWLSIGKYKINFNLVLDSLSLIMLSLVTSIGFLIHVFASWYMRGEEGYSRFFAYMNLFISSMIFLILADNLLMMYFGWEIVGLCSYLLIGFYYINPKNGVSAMKAFIVTRVSDVCLMLALFILYNELGTLNFREIIDSISEEHLEIGKNALWWSILMLLGGATGKSAQIPFHTWLADAMVGPTPVSALIHSSTMVTAGIYLIARTHSLFLMAPEILNLVSIIGIITLLMAGFSALAQVNIKRILAYSTISQLGYMFLALGEKTWKAAVFHLMMHAFFKGLLFLSSGSVILSCNHEQNIFRMGGLKKSMFLIYICFLVGGAALSSFPLITSGFFSKEEILVRIMSNGHSSLLIASLIGTFITSLYTFRMIFIIFHGENKIYPSKEGRGMIAHYFPLIILLILSTFVGKWIPHFQDVIPHDNKFKYNLNTLMLEITSGIVPILGILISAWLWLNKRITEIKIFNSSLSRALYTCWHNACGFDCLYKIIFVRPFLSIARFLRSDPLNILVNIVISFLHCASKNLLLSENGCLSWYITCMSFGIVIVLSLLMMSF